MANATTTLTIPSGVTALTSSAGATATFVEPSSTYQQSYEVTASSSFNLYVPLTASTPPASVDVHALVSTLGGPGVPAAASIPIQLFVANATGAISSLTTPVPEETLSSFLLQSGETLYVPFTGTLPSSADVGGYIASLAAVSQTPVAVTSNASSVSTTSSTTGSSPSSSATSSTTPTNTAKPSNDSVSSATLEGAVIGGVIGAFVLGLAIGLLALFCYNRRKKPKRTPSREALKDYSDRPTTQKEAPQDIGFAGAAGWQKHLPQEKDDRAITRAVDAIFEQIQIYVEGFYEMKQGRQQPGVATLAAVETYPCDNLSKLLSRTSKIVPILEGVLARWVVHSISLRSHGRDCLLPPDFTGVPARNNWHMEKDEQEVGSASESKRGFPPAFSQWRVLTGFLCSDSAGEREWTHLRSRDVDRAVQSLTEAFAPWAISGTKESDRTESLRRILHQASDTGVLLIKQPSTFMFDWTNESRKGDSTFVVRPAFVRRLDEYGEQMSPLQVLIDARKVSIS